MCVKSSSSLVDGRNIIQCNIRDVSARVKVQEASRTHLTALEVASKAKDEFLAALSHELRTPLSAISSMLDVLELQHNLGDMSSDVQAPTELDDSGLALIRRNVQVLVSLINGCPAQRLRSYRFARDAIRKGPAHSKGILILDGETGDDNLPLVARGGKNIQVEFVSNVYLARQLKQFYSH